MALLPDAVGPSSATTGEYSSSRAAPRSALKFAACSCAAAPPQTPRDINSVGGDDDDDNDDEDDNDDNDDDDDNVDIDGQSCW